MSAPSLDKEAYREHMKSMMMYISSKRCAAPSLDPSANDTVLLAQHVLQDLTFRSDEAQKKLSSLVEKLKETEEKSFTDSFQKVDSQKEKGEILKSVGEDLKGKLKEKSKEYQEASERREALQVRLAALSERSLSRVRESSWIEGASFAARSITFPLTK
jgi:hypothetical protein